MQQICYQRLSVPPLQLRKDAATVGTLRRAPLRACTLKLQASSIHASTDTAEQQQGIGVSSSYQPLTKARKKQHLPTASSDGWQTASKVARYAALAAGAVAAMTALHVDVINATATGAALGIGAAVLSSVNADADAKASRPNRGSARLFLGILALGRNASDSVTQAFDSLLQPSSSTTSGLQPGQLKSMDLHTHGLHRPGLLTKWENERDEVSFDPDKITDAQWAVCAKLIETSPCPVPMDGAQQFAQDFKATQKLPGQIVESQHGQVLSLEVHQTSTSEDIPRPAQQKLNGIVTQAKRREKQKKKQRKKRRKRN